MPRVIKIYRLVGATPTHQYLVRLPVELRRMRHDCGGIFSLQERKVVRLRRSAEAPNYSRPRHDGWRLLHGLRLVRGCALLHVLHVKVRFLPVFWPQADAPERVTELVGQLRTALFVSVTLQRHPLPT